MRDSRLERLEITRETGLPLRWSELCRDLSLFLHHPHSSFLLSLTLCVSVSLSHCFSLWGCVQSDTSVVSGCVGGGEAGGHLRAHVSIYIYDFIMLFINKHFCGDFFFVNNTFTELLESCRIQS